MTQEKVASLVSNEVCANVSTLMYHIGQDSETAAKLFNEAYENIIGLFYKYDWESPATEAGWHKNRCGSITLAIDTSDPDEESTLYAVSWEDACDTSNLDAYSEEVYEHWIVSGWLAEKLKAKGEVVGEFAGMTIWGRTTTGQAISMDWVITEIYRDLSK